MKKTIICIILHSLFFLTPLAYANYQSALPGGNYQQTCTNCYVSSRNDMLSCVCRDRNNFPQKTFLKISNNCSFVENINGNLQCTQWNNYQPPANPHHHHRHHNNYNSSFDVKAGPIWNQHDAQRKCPIMCKTSNKAHWTGQWRTIIPGQMSICQCQY
jgi:Mannan-binding protein